MKLYSEVCAIGLVATFLASADEPPKASIVGLQDFAKRANDYLNSRKAASSGLPPLKPESSPNAVGVREGALVQRIQSLRGNAKQGDIFTPAIAEQFRHLIGIATKAPAQARQIDLSLKHAEPVPLALHVNDSFPTGVPLQSTPPSLLSVLPELPKGLDYRVVGHALVLRDTEANMVVDFIPNAIP